VTVSAFGSVWAGWWFGSWFGPDGDTSQHGKTIGNGTKPVTNGPFSALLYGFGGEWVLWSDRKSFIYGEDTWHHPADQSGTERLIGSATTPLPMYVHINDDNVTNGKGNFYGTIYIQRRPLAGVGEQ